MTVEILRPGLFALVGMFFALSGFLVVGSAVRTMNLRTFFANRALRILPALSVEVFLSALVLGPLVTNLPLSEYFADSRFLAYFGNIVGHVTFELPGVFLNNPWPGMINANLWTLPPEFWCYLFMLGLIATGYLLRKWLTSAIILVAVIWLALNLYDAQSFSVRDDATHFTKWYIVVMFFFGVLFFLNSKRVILHPYLFIASAAIYYLLTLFNSFSPLSGVFLTYCTVYVGMMAFPLFDRLLKVDLSYGTYLYGFPITQGIIYFLLPSMGALPVAVRFLIILPLVIATTALFSFVSWTYIEKPALGLRRYIMRQPALPVVT